MESISRRAALALAAAMLMAGGAGAAQAAAIVQVSLWDKGASTEMPMGLAYAAPGLDLAKATMGIKVLPGAVKAGEVTFNVKNDSKDTVHEMIVMYLADPGKPLPYVEAENRVDEDKAGDKGEVSELDPGKSGTLTVELKAGKYLLICNVPGHFGAGMWAEFTVDPQALNQAALWPEPAIVAVFESLPGSPFLQVGPKHGGKVNRQAERRSTERAVWAVPGVRVVEDRIAVA